MLTHVFYISLTGIGVVFSFLLIIFLFLKGLKIFAVEEKTKDVQEKPNRRIQKKTVGDSISPELIAAITVLLNENNLITGENIVIRKK